MADKNNFNKRVHHKFFSKCPWTFGLFLICTGFCGYILSFMSFINLNPNSYMSFPEVLMWLSILVIVLGLYYLFISLKTPHKARMEYHNYLNKK